MGRVMDFLRHPFGKPPVGPDELREREELRGRAEQARLLARLAASEFIEKLTSDTITDITPGRRHS